MKNKQHFTLEDLMLLLVESYKELIEVLKDLRRLSSTAEDTDYRDAADTKRELNVSNSTLYRWRKEGVIDFAVKKGKIYYDILSVLKKK